MMRTRTDHIPCSSLIAEGAFRGAILGTIWGSVSDLELLESLISNHEGPVIGNRILRRANAVVHSAAGFALFIGTYSAGSCLAQRATGYNREDWIPAFVGGFAGGSAFTIRSRSVPLMLSIGSATGSLAAFFKYMHVP